MDPQSPSSLRRSVAASLPLIPAAAISDRARKARWVPASYGPDLVAAARRIMDRWNATIHAAGGPRVNAGDAGNVRAIKRFFDRCRRSDEPFCRIDEAALMRAIAAYRDAPCNAKLASWKRFRHWLDPEQVQIQLDRILAEQQSSETYATVADLAAAKEKRIQAELIDRFADLARAANDAGKSLRAYLRDGWQIADEAAASPHCGQLEILRRRADLSIWTQRLELLRRFDGLAIADRAAFERQAAALWTSHHGRAPRDCDAARNLLLGVSLALFERGERTLHCGTRAL